MSYTTPVQQPKAITIIQLTDMHLLWPRGKKLHDVDPCETFKQVLEFAENQSGVPDFYLLTGDLSNSGDEESYKLFCSLIKKLKAPAYYIPGNHDIPENMFHVFSTAGAPLNKNRNIIAGKWQVNLLNTWLNGKDGGHLSNEELEQLSAGLAQHPDKHALIVLHHHPIPIGSEGFDAIGLDNGTEFLNTIDQYTHVRGVLFGHIHQEFEAWRKGVRFMGAPSTCIQYRPQAPRVSDADIALVVDEVAPGYRWLKLNPDGSIVSAVVRV